MKYNEFEGEIRVKDTNMNYQVISRFDIDTSNPGLGLFVNPNGSMTLQLEALIEKATTWNDRLNQSNLSKKEAYVGVKTTLFNTIEYSLPGTSFSDTQCRKLERAIYKHLMNKVGVSSKFPL